ncbi:PREDICTED: uncharacterized protein LOC109462929 [Branchiostoma belcheri]|uniref:Uncharacterized protein LOC109462929 n=1 Tax=Branchiostoma belcheri TaxID=7741 RepID=A0A6P4XSQ4_BRABE|nr:PREDICTED: uncharacterized protein LOC109462929 [Branchiostoma belcheri]
MDDEGLFKMKGCEDHQEGDEWGTSDHDNCNCQGPYRFCYHVDCLSGSEIARDSKGLWDCPGGFSADDTVAENNKNDVDMSMLEKSLLQILQEDAPEPKAVDNAETRAVADKNDLDLGGVADDGLVRNGGCEGHQPGEQWGSSDHDNCICGESDRICYPVVCLPGSQIKPDSNRLWTCEVDSSKRDITAAAAVDKQQVIERVEDLLSFFQKLAEEKENAAVPEMDDEKLFKMKGCEDHQEGDEWGTSDHDNCNCQGPYRFCYHVDCLSGSEIARDSKGLWDCPGGFSADDTVAENNKNDVDMSMLEKSLLQILQEDAPEPKTADNAETRAVADKNDVDLGRVADDGLVRNGGCEGHQPGEQLGSSDHDNCICGESDRICYPVVCLPGSQIKPDSNRLWTCEVDSSKRDITGSAHELIEREKRFDITATGAATAFGVFTGVVGLIGFALDRYESAQTTAQLNEIQDQIRKLDGKIDGLTRSVSDLQLGQQYLQQVILYGRDELRLRNVLDTLASIRARNGRYVGSDVQGWADSVLSHDSDGIRNVLSNMLDMVNPRSSLFGGKSLFEIYRKQLNSIGGDLEHNMVKMRLKVAQVYGLIGGGYSAWATALRIKGRKHEIPSIVRTGKGKLSSVKRILQKYVDYGTCHGGYQRKNRKCYKAFGFLKAWHDASAYCRRQGSGGNLAMPKDRSTDNFVIELKNAKSTSKQFWFGLNDGGSEGRWKWNDGTTYSRMYYNNFTPGQPDNGYWKDWLGRYKRNEDCALYYEANKDTWNDTWNDVDCSLERYFICERTPFGLY